MDPSDCLDNDFFDSERNTNDILVNTENEGKRKSSSEIVTNVFETMETISEDDNNNNKNMKTMKNSAETEEFLSSNNESVLDETPNPSSCAHLPQSRPGAFSSAPGRAESSRIKGALTVQPDPTKQIDNLSLTNDIAPFTTNNNNATHDIALTIENDLSDPLRSDSTNVQSTADDLHLRTRARKEAKKNSGETVQRMHENVMEQKLAQTLGVVVTDSDVTVGVEEVAGQSPDEEEMMIGPHVPDLYLNSPPISVTETTALNLTIAAEVVDSDPVDMEAQIQERVNCLRDEMIRDTVQADAVKVITESELHTPSHHYGYWLTLFIIIVTVGVTLGIVLSRKPPLPQPPLPQPSQSPSQSICTLCLDGSTGIKYPDQRLPRQTEGFTCGSIASNPDLVTELLAGSSGNCSADVQIYAQYCGCPSTARNTGKKCNFCRFGLHPSNNMSTPVYNDSCVELASFVSSLSGDLCSANSATDVLACSAYCQCPSSRPTCSLCPIFTDSPFEKQVNVPFFNMTCGNLSDYVSIFTADQCTAYQDDIRQAAGICGCPPLSCSLCQLDDLELQNDSLLSNFNNFSCPALNGIIGSFSKEQCTTAQALITENNPQCCTPMTSAPTPSSLPISFHPPTSETFSPSVLSPGSFPPPAPSLLPISFYPPLSSTLSPSVVSPGTSSPSTISPGTSSSPVFASDDFFPPAIPLGTSSPSAISPGTSTSPAIPLGTSSPSAISPGTSSPSTISPGTSTSPAIPLGTSSPSAISTDTFSPSVIPPRTLSPSAISTDTFLPPVIPPHTLSPSAISTDTLLPSVIATDDFSPSFSLPRTLSPSVIPPRTLSPSVISPGTSSPSTILPGTSSPPAIPSLMPEMTSTPPPSQSCSLCPEGVSLPNPELVLSEGDTCGELSDLANGFSPDQCELQKDILTISAVSCGCS